MTTCGMYDGAGKFTKDIGVPSKSGVAGGLLSIIPGIGALASWSPPLNEEGNTVRGIEMVHKLNSQYNNFNLFHKDQNKINTQQRSYSKLISTVIVACECAALGDLEGIIRLHNMGVSLEEGDYDKRSPMHLAVANNHIKIA